MTRKEKYGWSAAKDWISERSITRVRQESVVDLRRTQCGFKVVYRDWQFHQAVATHGVREEEGKRSPGLFGRVTWKQGEPPKQRLPYQTNTKRIPIKTGEPLTGTASPGHIHKQLKLFFSFWRVITVIRMSRTMYRKATIKKVKDTLYHSPAAMKILTWCQKR